MTLNLIIAATLGALYGIVQSMCMVKPEDKMFKPLTGWLRVSEYEEGIRGHRWFKYWHLIFGAFLFEFAMFIHYLPSEPSTICLQLIVIWTFVEPCYNLTRYARLIPPDGMENVNLWDLKVRIPWIHKITWTEIEKADRPTHEVSAYNNTMTVSVYSTEELEVEKSKWGWHTIQILPFHVASWKMHWIRFALIIILAALTLI